MKGELDAAAEYVFCFYFNRYECDNTPLLNNRSAAFLTVDNWIINKLVSYWRMCNYFLLPVAELDDCY